MFATHHPHSAPFLYGLFLRPLVVNLTTDPLYHRATLCCRAKLLSGCQCHPSAGLAACLSNICVLCGSGDERVSPTLSHPRGSSVGWTTLLSWCPDPMRRFSGDILGDAPGLFQTGVAGMSLYLRSEQWPRFLRPCSQASWAEG